jgi:hypothetical protein
MRYLFSYKFILPRLLKLKCLPEQRIERLLRKLLNVCMLHSQVQTYIGESFNGVFFFCSLIQYEKVLCRAAHLLEETEGLVEVDGDCDFREVFAYGVFQDCPYTNLHLGVFKEWQFLSVWEGEWMRPCCLYDLSLFLFFKYRILKH